MVQRGEVVKTTHELPEELSIYKIFTTTPGRNLIAYRNPEEGKLSFLHVPPVTGQRPIEWWSIPPFPFIVDVFAVYPPDNLLAVAEEEEQ